MALERRNPLPAGRYWLALFRADEPAFFAWLAEHKGVVSVVATQQLDSDSTFWTFMGQGTEHSPGTWVRFDVSSPVPFSGPGYPTIVPPGAVVEQTADVVTAPGPDVIDPPWFGSFAEMKPLLAAAFALWVLSQRR